MTFTLNKIQKSIWFFCFALCFVTVNNVSAQTNLKEIGNISAVKINGQRVSITTNTANVEAIVYSPTIVRIRMDKQPLKKDFSYAVVAEPMQTKVTITQTGIQMLMVTVPDKIRSTQQFLFISVYTTT